MRLQIDLINIIIFFQIFIFSQLTIAHTLPSRSSSSLSIKLRNIYYKYIRNIKTSREISDKFKSIIKNKDTTFNDNKNNENIGFPDTCINSKIDEECAVWYYTRHKEHSKVINFYLMDEEYNGIFYFEDRLIESWIYLLHKFLTNSEHDKIYNNYKVNENTVVYRGTDLPISDFVKASNKFYFKGFTSTSLDKTEAEKFKSKNGTLLIITIKNNDVNKYCKNIAPMSYYEYEQEILITAFSIFQKTKIDITNNIVYLDCLGIDYCSSDSTYKASISSNIDEAEIEICDYDIIDIDNNDDKVNHNDDYINDNYHYQDHDQDQKEDGEDDLDSNNKVWILVALGAIWSAIVYIFCCRCC